MLGESDTETYHPLSGTVAIFPATLCFPPFPVNRSLISLSSLSPSKTSRRTIILSTELPQEVTANELTTLKLKVETELRECMVVSSGFGDWPEGTSNYKANLNPLLWMQYNQILTLIFHNMLNKIFSYMLYHSIKTILKAYGSWLFLSSDEETLVWEGSERMRKREIMKRKWNKRRKDLSAGRVLVDVSRGSEHSAHGMGFV